MSTGTFVPLGRYAYMHRAIASPASRDSKDPTVVIIFGWMGAKLSLLHKYTATYLQLYPHATVVLIRSPPTSFLLSMKKRQAFLRPVAEVLKALGCLDDEARILTHTFSNGGLFQLVTLAGLLPPVTVDARSPSALIIDSAPGGDSLDKVQLAFAGPIKNILLKFLTRVLITFVYCIIWTFGQLLRRQSPLRVLMTLLLNPRVLPWIDKRSPRLYIYSKADDMVDWTDVEKHASRSAEQGIDVRRLRFDDSAHAAHIRQHPEEYWAAVVKTWDDACSKRQ
ncbi:hypothetical protein C8J57DRAFT_1119285 [Mycena rebaudengoi]|nr:hypothetical protein C8J57DRAFT_1119285 [Mycena rebaudengoi]